MVYNKFYANYDDSDADDNNNNNVSSNGSHAGRWATQLLL